MTPLCPEAALTTITARVRTPSGKLYDDRAFPAPVRIVSKINQLPAYAVSVEVVDHGPGRCRNRLAICPHGDAGDTFEVSACAQHAYQLAASFLAFASHDDIKLRAVAQDIRPVISWKDTAIDHYEVWQDTLGSPGNLGGYGMG